MSDDNYVQVSLETEDGRGGADVDVWYAVRDRSWAWRDKDTGEWVDDPRTTWHLDGTTLSVTGIEGVMGLRLLLDEIEARMLAEEKEDN